MNRFLALTRHAMAAAIIASASLSASRAIADSDCGKRDFPSTLAIEDPTVGNELSLPTLTYLPADADGMREYDASFSLTRLLAPGLGFTVSDERRRVQGSGTGWGNLGTGLKYQLACDAPHEFMSALGFGVEWGHTGSARLSNPFNTYSPYIDLGLGFGALPDRLNILRPFAVTAQVGLGIPGREYTWITSINEAGLRVPDVSSNPTTLQWGFTIQYSLPYANQNVQAIDDAFLRHLIPIAEFAFQNAIAGTGPDAAQTTGTIQPGLIYATEKWQLAVEAILPINGASGKHVGLIAELHFDLDAFLLLFRH